MVLRLAHESQRRAGDEPGGALGADDRADQIVTASLLSRSAQLYNFASGRTTSSAST